MGCFAVLYTDITISEEMNGLWVDLLSLPSVATIYCMQFAEITRLPMIFDDRAEKSQRLFSSVLPFQVWKKMLLPGKKPHVAWSDTGLKMTF